MKLVHGFFFFSEESLKGELFFVSFGSVCTERFVFLSFTEFTESSQEFGRVDRVRPSFNRLIQRLVSGVGIDVVRT